MSCDVCKWAETPFEPCPNAIEDGTAAVTVFWPIDLTVVGNLSFRNVRYGSGTAEGAYSWSFVRICVNGSGMEENVTVLTAVA
jgi:hypothetical protein